MAFKKGQSGNPKGRAKGKPNKVNRDVRERILAVADKMDLEQYAADNPRDFWNNLYSKLIPKDINLQAQLWTRQLSDAEIDQRILRLMNEIDMQEVAGGRDEEK